MPSRERTVRGVQGSVARWRGSRAVQLRPRQGRGADYAMALYSLYGAAVQGSTLREVSGVDKP